MKYKISDKSLLIRGYERVHILEGKCQINFKEFKKNDFIHIPQSKSIEIIPDGVCELELDKNKAREIKTPKYFKKIPKLLKKIENKATILVLGESDVGKTNLIIQLANLLYDRGKKIGIIDSDIGQSDIGIPACISYGHLDSKKVFMDEISPKKSYFVGAISPNDHLIDMIVGTKEMLNYAKEENCNQIFIDTTSLNTREIGRKLKRAKINYIKPDLIIAIQKENELIHLTKNYPNAVNIKPYKNIGHKSEEARFLLRDRRWKKHFEVTKEHIIELDKIRLLNTVLGSGVPVRISGRKFITEMVGCKVVYAEEVAEGFFVVIDGNPTKNYYEIYKMHKIGFEVGLLIGLVDKDSQLIGVGIIKQIDFKKKIMEIISPIESIKNVSSILVGEIRLSPIGDEIGKIKAGSV